MLMRSRILALQYSKTLTKKRASRLIMARCVISGAELLKDEICLVKGYRASNQNMIFAIKQKS